MDLQESSGHFIDSLGCPLPDNYILTVSRENDGH
jgi:hypothetical protein